MDTLQAERLTAFVKAVAQVDRLRILGTVAERPCTVSALASRLNLKERDLFRHLAQLQAVGLIRRQDGEYALNRKALEQMNHALFSTAVSQNTQDVPARVMRHYVDADEQLRELPYNQEEMMVILRWLADKFEPGARYPESEVRFILQRHHSDHATLRRYLVDYQLLAREHGVYWRTGN